MATVEAVIGSKESSMFQYIEKNIHDDSEVEIIQVTKKRTHALTPANKIREYKLGEILKESHGESFTGVSFNPSRNILFTYASNQINIYDNENFGKHIDLTSRFINTKNEHAEGGVITTACWSPNGTMILFADSSKCVSVIDLREHKVIHRSDPLPEKIVEIKAWKQADQFFCISGNYLFAFELGQRKPTGSVKVSEETLTCFEVYKKQFYCASSTGDILKVLWQENKSLVVDEKYRCSIEAEELNCLQTYGDKWVIGLSKKSTLFFFHREEGSVQRKEKVSKFSEEVETSFSIAGDILSCGNNVGAIKVYDLTQLDVPDENLLIESLEIWRITKPVTCCAIASNFLSLVAGTEDGLLCRWRHPELQRD
eukprot:maker-scaffold_9-snap-gene-0.5-mRNA-1 protein AED:0.00 eAED:0.00 QI:46/1/1/1/1/1/6/89/368